jgi:hypothetical protein
MICLVIDSCAVFAESGRLDGRLDERLPNDEKQPT